MAISEVKPEDKLEQLRQARIDDINHFRVTGKLESGRVEEIKSELEELVETAEGATRAVALFELATVLRLTNQFKTAIDLYARCAAVAETLQDNQTLFDAYLGIARCHAYGTQHHGAAAAAFDRAVPAAGDHPTQKQQYELADYASQIQAFRGELDAALINGLEAIRLQNSAEQEFYAELDTADVLQKYAESCDYRKLIDAKTIDDVESEASWGACRRAVAAAKEHYGKAQKIARKLGWEFLDRQAADFRRKLDLRLSLIERQASFENMGLKALFQAQDVSDVLINASFDAGGSMLPNKAILGTIIDGLNLESQPDDPRSLYLLGCKADLDGKPEEALSYFQQAARRLMHERTSFFELRQRGTVLENRIEIVRDLGLLLLKFNQFSDAFLAFESVRSYGLGAINAALEHSQITDTDRKALADLVQQASRLSVLRQKLVQASIAGIESDHFIKWLEEIAQTKQSQQKLRQHALTQTLMGKITSMDFALPTLETFQRAVKTTGIPVLCYWVTHANVIVWVITPEQHQVRAVFLPEVAVIHKVKKLRASLKSGPAGVFDTTSARELHTYLIKPFLKHLSHRQVIIIPQGALVDLPFEVLLDAKTGRFLVQDRIVSYAPSAAFALKAMIKNLPEVREVTALHENITIASQEIPKLKKIEDLQVRDHMVSPLANNEIFNLMKRSKNLHVLLHGRYDSDDPLQSTLSIEPHAPTPRNIRAAQLLAVDWANTGLAVFSSCEGAKVHTRISNELFGFSWALLAGGVDSVVLSRWRVNEASNAGWMERFYQTLVAEQQSPATAAAATMRTMIKNGERNPYYWAGPQVFGR